MSEYNALTALAQKKERGVYRIPAQIRAEGTDENAAIVLTLPLRELQKARPGTNGRRSVGFALAPSEFTLPDGTRFQLSAPWVSITAR